MLVNRGGVIPLALHLHHGLRQPLEPLQVGLVGVGAVHRGGSLIPLLLKTQHGDTAQAGSVNCLVLEYLMSF